jgi:hypothetical protein
MKSILVASENQVVCDAVRECFTPDYRVATILPLLTWNFFVSQALPKDIMIMRLPYNLLGNCFRPLKSSLCRLRRWPGKQLKR